MSDIRRIVTNTGRGRVVVHSGLVYLGGQTAEDRSQDIKGQTAQVLAKMDKVLAEAGTDRTRLLTTQIWLKDIARDFAGMNEVWDAWISPETAPARATAQCEMAASQLLIEITATAALP
jgi:enamine deaminase RidA (YjgF/YER057c/UK114 family)